MPDPQEAASFRASRLDWTEAGDEPRATVLHWHRELIALRAANQALRDGDRSAIGVPLSPDWPKPIA